MISRVVARRDLFFLPVALALVLVASVVPGVAPAGAGDGDLTSKIYFGDDTPPGSFPFMVAVLQGDSGDDFQDQRCGGSLVAETYVLTAAHCLDLVGDAPLQLLVGIRDLDNHSESRVAPVRAVRHPEFSPESLRNDIALLEVPPQTGKAIVPMVAPGQESLWEPGDITTVIGWGQVEDTSFPSILQQVSFPRFDDETCAAELEAEPGETIVYDPAVMLCAGERGGTPDDPVADVCQGDSGSPLLVPDPAKNVSHLQIGLVSFGRSCGLAPSAYTRLAAFTAWADEIIAGYFSDTLKSIHNPNIRRVKDAGITTGFPDGTYRPFESVERGQMATLLAKALDVTPGGGSPFTDVDGSVHRENIEGVYNAGIATGFPDGTYRPLVPVTRGQMASFLARALGLPEAGDAGFTDTAGSVHRDAINRVAAAGIASGFGDGTFRPDEPVQRDQFATMLVNAELA